MAGERELDPALRAAIRAGLMTEAQARDVDAFADGIVARIRAGEMTEEEASSLAVKQGIADGLAALRKRGRP